jgi:hypothetical protein
MASPTPEDGSLRARDAEPDGTDAAEGDDHHETYPADNQLPFDDPSNNEVTEDSDPDKGATGDGNYSNYPRYDPIDPDRPIVFRNRYIPRAFREHIPAASREHSAASSSFHSPAASRPHSPATSHSPAVSREHSVATSRPNSAASFRIHSQRDPLQSSACRQGPTAQVRSTYVASRFQNHRKGLRRELESLKDKKGRRLYTDSQINRQLSHSRTEEPSQKAQHDLDDSTFGKIGFISYFSDAKSPLPKFNCLEFPVSKMTINDSAFTESEQDTDPWDFRWVHLPANNFEWVYV